MQYTQVISALFLIAGTSVGAGMLALPLITAQVGLVPSLLIFLLTWFVMLLAALYMLEVNLSMAPGTHLLSMAEKNLGKVGKWVALTTYLLLLYALNAAYLSGMSAFVQTSSQSVLHLHVYQWFAMLLLVAVFSFLLFLGRMPIARINRYLVILMLAGFSLLMLMTLPHIHENLNQPMHWSLGWHILPVTITAFGYQIIIPSLRHYLGSDAVMLRRVIIAGSLIPLLMYVIWMLVVFGIIPVEGASGLIALNHHHQPAVALIQTLTQALNSPMITSMGQIFTFLAMITSFIGVSISLFDFLNDAFKLKSRQHHGRFGLILLTFVPALLFNLLEPRSFMLALSYAGIFVAVLLGILPLAMFLAHKNKLTPSTNQTRIYRSSMITTPIVGLFCLAVIGAQLLGY